MLSDEVKKHQEVVNNATQSDKEALLQVVRDFTEFLGEEFAID